MSMAHSFKTVRHKSEALYKEKGSKFLAFVFPVSDKHEVDLCLSELRKVYHDARHQCYAYILGFDGNLELRANDDGEPKHSAGDPILGQIKSANLTNTLIVVVRYFGGTKLGVSGLINAYKTAAQEAIKANHIIKVYITQSIEIKFPYASTNEVMQLINSFDVQIVSQDFDEDCTIIGRLKINRLEAFEARIKLLQQTGTVVKSTNIGS